MATHFEDTEGQAPALENVIPALERLDSLIGATNASRISALHNALPDLEWLAEALAAERAEQVTGLRNFGMAESLHRLKNSFKNSVPSLMLSILLVGRDWDQDELSGVRRNSIPMCWPGYWTQGKVTVSASISSTAF